MAVMPTLIAAGWLAISKVGWQSKQVQRKGKSPSAGSAGREAGRSIIACPLRVARMGEMDENPYESPRVPSGLTRCRRGDNGLSRWIQVALLATGIAGVVLAVVSAVTHLLDS
jgi:hypothetical protein